MLILCSAIITGGHILFTIGLSEDMFKLMIVGRFFFGIGSESTIVAQYILLTKYFSGGELSLAMTISSTMSTLGNVLNMLLTPRIAAYLNLETAVWVGVFLCLGGLVCIMIAMLIDKGPTDNQRLHYILLRKKPEYDIIEFKVNQFKKFDRIFWYIAFTHFFLFSSIICWINIGPSFLVESWFNHRPIQEAQILAGNCIAVIWITSVILGPFVGNFVDNYGLRSKILVLATIICTISMLMFLFVFPFIPSFLLGVSYTFGTASIFPCVAYVVPEESLGKANGLVISLQNLGYFIFPYIIASLKVYTGGYDSSQLFLLITSCMALLFAWKTYKENLKKGHNLELEVDMMDAVGVEVLALQNSGSEDPNGMDYQILHSDERINLSR